MSVDNVHITSSFSVSEHKTWVEIDADALASNFRLIREAIGPDRSVIQVVKSDGYGHGAETVVRVARECGIHRFAVATVDEGIELRCCDIEDEILLLHAPLDFEMPSIVEWDITPTISDEKTALAFNELLSERRPVHIEINTGINRLGLEWDSAVDVILNIANLPHVFIGGIFTHFRTHNRAKLSGGAEATREQMRRFEHVLGELTSRGINYGVCHATSSYPLLYHPETYLHAVRPGLLPYGGMASDDAAHQALVGIKPVMSVKARIMHIRDIEAGEWVHYGATYQAKRPMRLAVVPIGYGMGYPHRASNKGSVLIQGRRAPMVGVVGMDITMVDLAGHDSVQVGDVVTVLGPDSGDVITAEQIAGWAETIPYEVTCSLGNALPRCVVNPVSLPAEIRSQQITV